MNLNRSRDPTAWGEQTGGPLSLISGISLPFAKAPTLGLDGAGNRWVIAASGRYEARPDRETGSRQRQALIGILDPPRSTSLPYADPTLTGSQTTQGLLNVTNALVFSDGSIDLDGADSDGDILPQYSHLSLRAAVERAGGWKRWFNTPTTAGTQLAERGVSGILSIGTTLLLPAFTPDTAACVTEGKSTLLGLALETGVPPERGVFGTVPCPQCRQAESLADLVPPSPPASAEPLANPADFTAIQYEGRLEATSLVGQIGGLRSGSSADGGFSARLCAQSSTASLQCENIRLKDRIASQEISWRQRRR